MAKSMRSKVKRSWRTKKRETGVYAATEAARLNRLHSKLVAVKESQKVDTEGEEDEGDEMDIPGWLPIIGLLDQGDITAENMEKVTALEGWFRAGVSGFCRSESSRRSFKD